MRVGFLSDDFIRAQNPAFFHESRSKAGVKKIKKSVIPFYDLFSVAQVTMQNPYDLVINYKPDVETSLAPAQSVPARDQPFFVPALPDPFYIPFEPSTPNEAQASRRESRFNLDQVSASPERLELADEFEIDEPFRAPNEPFRAPNEPFRATNDDEFGGIDQYGSITSPENP